jgi:hypothetical protein
MDIHKPKPWHGVREFLKEIGTIVIGVLIALGAEAVVERLHEARLSDEAQAIVRDEINVDITNMATRFAPEREDCVQRRLDEIDALLDRAEAGQAFAPPAVFGMPKKPLVFTQRWVAATAGGRTSLLSSTEQRKFGRVYAYLQRLDEDLTQERDAWFTLHALKGLRRLPPETLQSQRLALSRARDLDYDLRLNLNQATYHARQLGLKGDARLDEGQRLLPTDPRRWPNICQSIYGPASGQP